LKKEESIDLRKDGETLHSLVSLLNFDRILTLFKMDPDCFSKEEINSTDDNGNTPLMIILLLSESEFKAEKALKIAFLLLNNKANPKAKCKDGWTVIDEAISQGNTRFLCLVFEA
jgi:hypothetical protein